MMTEFSVEDKLHCIERELRFRRVIYEKRVGRQAMSQQQADWEIGCMESIARDYRTMAASGGNCDLLEATGGP